MQLLEREPQLQTLLTTIENATAGRGCTVLVSGEAGIGKTWLVERFTRESGDRARLLWGACEALFTPRPLGPFYDIVHALGGQLLTQLQNGAKPVDLFHGLLDSIRRHDRPSVLVLEDVHWADHATLDFVRFVARRIPKLPAALVCTYRDDEVGADHPLMSVLGEIPPGDQITLKLPALSRPTVERLAREAGRAEADVFRITGGNPFFVSEILASPTDTIAPNVRQAVLSRARYLSGGARALLDLVSVVPDRLELALLEGPLGVDLGALEECAERGLLVMHQDHVSFRHEIARLAIETALSSVKRTRLNRTMLEALARSTLDPRTLTRLAHHAIAAKDADSIVRFAPQAAQAATERGAHREAAVLLAGALPYVHRLQTADRAAFFEQRARACFVIDEGADAIAMSEAAYPLWESLGDELAQARNLVRRCEIVYAADLFRRHEVADMAEQARKLLEARGPSAELAIARTWQGFLLMPCGSQGDRRADRR
jgi:hypothetical protein